MAVLPSGKGGQCTRRAELMAERLEQRRDSFRQAVVPSVRADDVVNSRIVGIWSWRGIEIAEIAREIDIVGVDAMAVRKAPRD